MSVTASTTVIGIDCAVSPANIGLARAEFAGGQLALTHVETGTTDLAVEQTVKAWLDGGKRTLLALDCPLGWPASLGEALTTHVAGQALPGEPNHLFHRRTDDVIRSRLGKNPLEVGADRIARTAHATLGLLDRVRNATGRDIALAWEPGSCDGVFAIEVYPAATLKVRGLIAAGYKKPTRQSTRGEILRQLEPLIAGIDDRRSEMLRSADALDAVLCTLAGADFLRGDVMKPNIDREVVEREGWIWVRPPRET